MDTSKLKVTFLADGTVKLDARGMKGKTPTILAELEALAREIGGELVVEKHVEKHHHHGETDEHEHHHH